MSRFLADLLGAINAVLAALIVLVGGYIGFVVARMQQENLTFGVGLGLVAGAVVAALVCGLLATVILIERHLRLIADDVEEMRSQSGSNRG